MVRYEEFVSSKEQVKCKIELSGISVEDSCESLAVQTFVWAEALCSRSVPHNDNQWNVGVALSICLW